jgi:hypothetical protein
MTTAQIIEVAFAAGLIVGAAVLYRRRAQEDGRQGSQGAVLLLIIGIILLIHGTGLLEYRPAHP